MSRHIGMDILLTGKNHNLMPIAMLAISVRLLIQHKHNFMDKYTCCDSITKNLCSGAKTAVEDHTGSFISWPVSCAET